jgi:hypothetical protein
MGAVENWPPQLKALAEVMLEAVQPMFITWATERILLHNDAYVPLLGKRLPGAARSSQHR